MVTWAEVSKRLEEGVTLGRLFRVKPRRELVAAWQGLSREARKEVYDLLSVQAHVRGAPEAEAFAIACALLEREV